MIYLNGQRQNQEPIIATRLTHIYNKRLFFSQTFSLLFRLWCTKHIYLSLEIVVIKKIWWDCITFKVRRWMFSFLFIYLWAINQKYLSKEAIFPRVIHLVARKTRAKIGKLILLHLMSSIHTRQVAVMI